MSAVTGFTRDLLAQPTWIVVWVAWLIVVNTLSVALLRHREARLTLYAWLANLPTMTLLYTAFGYVRLLGLAHLIWWTPLLILLWRARPWPRAGAFGLWIRLLVATNAISWVIDLVDVIRYLAGDRG